MRHFLLNNKNIRKKEKLNIKIIYLYNFIIVLENTYEYYYHSSFSTLPPPAVNLAIVSIYILPSLVITLDFLLDLSLFYVSLFKIPACVNYYKQYLMTFLLHAPCLGVLTPLLHFPP